MTLSPTNTHGRCACHPKRHIAYLKHGRLGVLVSYAGGDTFGLPPFTLLDSPTRDIAPWDTSRVSALSRPVNIYISYDHGHDELWSHWRTA